MARAKIQQIENAARQDLQYQIVTVQPGLFRDQWLRQQCLGWKRGRAVMKTNRIWVIHRVEEALAFQGQLDGNERCYDLLPGYKEDEAV